VGRKPAIEMSEEGRKEDAVHAVKGSGGRGGRSSRQERGGKDVFLLRRRNERKRRPLPGKKAEDTDPPIRRRGVLRKKREVDHLAFGSRGRREWSFIISWVKKQLKKGRGGGAHCALPLHVVREKGE